MPVATKYPDIYFTPEYQELFKDTAFGGEPCVFEHAGIDYRFYKRPIAGTPYFDIVSPYGYSGPVAVSERTVYERDAFTYEFSDYCQKQNIIAEFARMHPFDWAWMFLVDELHYERDVFYIDLTKSEAEIFKGFDKGCRSAIKQAEKKLNILHAEAGNVAMFSLYRSRMMTLGASNSYQFDGAFFSKLTHLPGATSILAHNGDEYVAGAVILIHGDYAHYFLSGSIPAANYSNATNLIIWEAVKLAKARGCKIFNLGGGLKTGDGLESFKRSFTKQSKPFYSYRKVHNPEVYAELAKGIETDFFPAYRAERTTQ